MRQNSSPDMVRGSRAASEAEGSRRRPWWLLPIASGLLIAIIIASIVFVVTRTFVAGNWYGPGNFEGASDTVAIAAYMQLSQQITGSISGSGQICATSAQGIVQAPMSIAGNISGTTVNLTVTLNAANASAAVPLASTLAMRGTLADGSLTFSGTTPPGLLTLQQGSQSDFTTACSSLAASS